MRNRIPTPGQEGRVLVTPENGSSSFYAKLSMADNPIEQGTPFATATMLTDETAELFGLTNTAVPDDVFAFLAHKVKDLAEADVEIVTGSYTGTGTYGSDNMNVLTFDKEPVAVFIAKDFTGVSVGYGNSADTFVVLLKTGLFSGGSNNNTAGRISGTTATWGNVNSASQQMNESGKKYIYLALFV